MERADLFRLGTGLETGAHGEEPRDLTVAAIVSEDAGVNPHCLFDDTKDDHFIRRDGAVFAGSHLIIELEDGHGLDDEDRIQQAFRDCVVASGATLLHVHTHKFSPQGVSGVAVLAESHISCHTWPEIGYAAFDVFMCGSTDPWATVPVLKQAFGTDRVQVREIRRGEGIVSDSDTAAA